MTGLHRDRHLFLRRKNAEASVVDYLGIKELPKKLPAPVRAAILLRVGDLYENREAQIDRPLHGNPTFERLLNPYRVMAL